jgi:hypothetical protein
VSGTGILVRRTIEERKRKHEHTKTIALEKPKVCPTTEELFELHESRARLRLGVRSLFGAFHQAIHDRIQ